MDKGGRPDAPGGVCLCGLVLQGESKPVVEVWSRSSLIRTLALDQAHGKVMGDAWFG